MQYQKRRSGLMRGWPGRSSMDRPMGYAIRTQKEVGEILGLTQVEVSMLERSAMRKIYYVLFDAAWDEGYQCPPFKSRRRIHKWRKT